MSEDNFLLFSDLKKLFFLKKRVLLKIGFLTALVTFVLASLLPVSYEAKATFKESVKGQQGGSSLGLLNSFIGQVISGTDERQAPAIMSSRLLLRKVVADLGMQIERCPRMKLLRFIRRLSDNISAEFSHQLSDREIFLFRNVLYDGEAAKTLYFIFQTPEEFSVQEEGGLCIYGKVGQRVQEDEIAFTLIETPQHISIGKSYSFTLHPAYAIVDRLLNKVQVKPHKKYPSILQLTFKHKDRQLAKDFLNQLMWLYKDYLTEENHQIAISQLSYLEKRKEELSNKMEEDLSNYVTYIKENLGQRGFFGLSQQIETLSLKRQKYDDELLSFERELKILDYPNQFKAFSFNQSPFAAELGRMQSERHQLIKDRDTIEIALGDHALYHSLERHLENLESAEVNHHPFSPLQRLFSQLNIDKKRFYPTLKPIPSSDLVSLREWKNHLIYKKKKVANGDAANFLDHQIRLATLKEKISRESLFFPQRKNSEFYGIDLKMAKKLYFDYSHQLDEIEVKSKHYLYLQNQVKNPDFELSSLSTVLTDSVSQSFIQEASALRQKLRDEENLSMKDQARMKETLLRHRESLKEHIYHIHHLNHLQGQLIRDKISSLHHVMLDLTNQEISLVETQIEDALSEQKAQIRAEKDLVVNRLKRMRHEMKEIPEKYFKERQLKYRNDLNMSMIQGMSELVETKNIEHHLSQVESTPLDMAYVLPYPKPPHLRLFSILSGCLGILVSYGVFLGRGLSNGLPLSLNNLRLKKRAVCGTLSSKGNFRFLSDLEENNLETVRHVAAFISNIPDVKVISLIGGNGPNYAELLAELFAKQNKKSLVVQMSFDEIISKKETPGLLQYLQGSIEKCPIRNKEGYDYLPMGGSDKFGFERMKHFAFLKWLEEMHNHYDYLLFFTHALPVSAEAKGFLSFSDGVLITLNEESYDDLFPYYFWADRQSGERVSIIGMS